MFALVDCNSFFASCEQVFRPDLVGKPVVVLSNNDGVVVARSAEAKKLGIPMGEPFFKIKRLVEQNRIHVFSSNYILYNDLSRRVMRTLEQWSPNVEVYSIDEAFLDFDGLGIDDFDALGRTMTETVRKWTGIPVSVGIAPTKTLAKIAAETAKTRGIAACDLSDETAWDTVLKEFDIGDVWGVGRRLVKPFRNLGLRTAYDLSRVDPIWMRRQYSIIQEKTVRELRGEPCFGIEPPQPKKSIQVSRSFGDATDRLEDLEEAVATFAAKAAQKAREQGSVAPAVYVHVNTSWFHKDKASYYSDSTVTTFPIPTSSSPEIVSAAIEGLRRIYKPALPYKKATVILLDLLDADVTRSQGYLFEKDEKRNSDRRETERRLMESLDEINRRLGSRTVFFGAEGIEQTWRPRRENVSPNYTTDMDGLPVVR